MSALLKRRLQDAIEGIQTLLGNVVDVLGAPAYAPDCPTIYPLSIAFPSNGYYEAGAMAGDLGEMKGMHNVSIAVPVARIGTPYDVQAAVVYGERIARALLRDPTLNASAETFDRVSYQFGDLSRVTGQPAVGFLFTVEKIKQEQLIALLYDTFTGADDTAITDHVMETGDMWTTNRSGAEGTCVLTDNQLCVLGGGTLFVHASASTGNVDVSVSFSWDAGEGPTPEGVQIVFREDNVPPCTNYWYMKAEDPDGAVYEINLYKVESGVATKVASGSATITSTWVKMRVVALNDTITGYINDVAVVSAVDTFNQTEQWVGMIFTPDATFNYYADDFLALPS